MLLVIDIGNTNIVLGVFRGQQLIRSWRISTRKEQTADEYGILCRNLFQLDDLKPSDIHHVAISSVVPPLNESFLRMSLRYFERQPLFVDPEKQDLIRILYEPVADVGADRIVNAVAARERYGCPCVVVDFGTATTFDAISREGDYLGGVIAPGIGISAEALFARASRLPRVEIRRPPSVVGGSTVHSIQSGLFYGYVGLVDEILKRMQGEMGESRIVATGGLAQIFERESKLIQEVEEDLTVHGLRIFHERLGGR